MLHFALDRLRIGVTRAAFQLARLHQHKQPERGRKPHLQPDLGLVLVLDYDRIVVRARKVHHGEVLWIRLQRAPNQVAHLLEFRLLGVRLEQLLKRLVRW